MIYKHLVLNIEQEVKNIINDAIQHKHDRRNFPCITN